MHHGEDESTSYAFGMFIVGNQISLSMYTYQLEYVKVNLVASCVVNSFAILIKIILKWTLYLQQTHPWAEHFLHLLGYLYNHRKFVILFLLSFWSFWSFFLSIILLPFKKWCCCIACMSVYASLLVVFLLWKRKRITNTRRLWLLKIKCENINTHLDLGVKSTLHRYAIIYFCGYCFRLSCSHRMVGDEARCSLLIVSINWPKLTETRQYSRAWTTLWRKCVVETFKRTSATSKSIRRKSQKH